LASATSCGFWSFAFLPAVPLVVPSTPGKTGDKTTELDQVIQFAYDQFKWTMEVAPAAAVAHRESGGTAVIGPTSTIYFPREIPFKQAAETLAGFVIAFVGGVVAQWFYATRDRDGEASTP
jgi:hypothetical protein